MNLLSYGSRGPDSRIESVLKKLRKQGISVLNSMEKADQRLIWNWANEVVDAYRKTLSQNTRNLRSAAELPVAKNDIQLAIKLSVLPHITVGPKKMVKVLQDNYAELALFQEISEADRKKLGEAIEATEQQSNLTDQEQSNIYHKYIRRASQERKQFFQDINSFINDLPV